jgi:CDP-diacylglycerol--glycerol-3-phosphate 3-phosphatidyltransferase
VTLPDQLTIARALSVPVVVVLYEWEFPRHDYWATGVFIAAMATDWLDGRIARRRGHTSALGSLLDPVADKLLVLSVLIVLIDQGVFPSSQSSRASSSSRLCGSRRSSAGS